MDKISGENLYRLMLASLNTRNFMATQMASNLNNFCTNYWHGFEAASNFKSYFVPGCAKMMALET